MMTPHHPEVEFCSAVAADVPAMTHQLVGIQNEQTLPLTIWSSPKVEQFVYDVVVGERPDLDMRFFVARYRAEVHGVICVRNVGGAVFIDNTYISPELRAMQTGATFNMFATRTFELEQLPGASAAAWDVWSFERSIMAWHKRVGGVEQGRSSWYALPASAAAETAGVIGLTQAAEAQHARYGFSMFDVVTDSGAYKVGRLGAHAFRITNRQAAKDPQLLASLRELDPERSTYALLDAQDPDISMTPIATSVHFQASLSRLYPRLEAQIPKTFKNQ